MRARHFSTIGLLITVAMTGCEHAERGAASRPAEAPVEWVLAYVMSYDNDLEYCEPIILDALKTGLVRPGVEVAVLADNTSRRGLVRHVLTSGGHSQTRLDTDNSASEQVLEQYFDWVAREHPARRYAAMFLDHGGQLDEMCRDEWTGEGNGPKWLSARRTGDVMRGFRAKAPGEVRLIFLQQCGRGTVDNLYNFRGTADAIMASEVVVGAPNTYYSQTIRWLGENPEASGVELARKIMATDEQFTHYVCVDGARVGKLPQRVAPLVKQLLSVRQPPKRPTSPAPCFSYGTESCYDLLGWFEAALAANGQDAASRETFEAFSKWVTHDLIVAARANPREPAAARGLSGLGLWAPASPEVLARYPGYPFHAASDLDELWAAMVDRTASR